jgi:hypothetical protein
MDKFAKKIAAFYAKHIAAALGFSFLYALAFLTGNPDNSLKVNDMYEEVTKKIHYPVHVKLPKALRESARVA